MPKIENKTYASTGKVGACTPAHSGHCQPAKVKVEPLVTAAFTAIEPTVLITDLVIVTRSAGLPPLLKIDPGIFVRMIPGLDFVGSRELGILGDDDCESRRSLKNPGDRPLFLSISSGLPGLTRSIHFGRHPLLG